MIAVLTAGAARRGLASNGAMFAAVLSAIAVMGVALAWMPILALLPLAALGLLLLVANSDGSYQERIDQTRIAWSTFVSEPVLGSGPRHLFEWTTAAGKLRASFTIDTGLSFPAKFGAGGVLVLLALVLAFVSFLRNAGRGSRLTVPQVALLGYAALAFLNLPFSFDLEDKGSASG